MQRHTAVVIALLMLMFRFELSAAPPEGAAGVTQIVGHRGAAGERPENTLASFARGIEAGATAVEMDVRTTKDKQFVLCHNPDVNHTTNGEGLINDLTLAEIKAFDAGSWFDQKFKDEKMPTLREGLAICRGKIDVLLDLKEQGDDYAQRVAAEVKSYGEPKRTIVGVRSVEQAKLFRKLLPESRQLGLIPEPRDIEPFVAAGVETIRLWPRWLTDETLVLRVKKAGVKLHFSGATGLPDEVLPLLKHHPDSLSSDYPARLRDVLNGSM